MDILNIVFSALNLLATVVIGVINVTWMISRDVFRDKPRAKHDSKKKMARKKPCAEKNIEMDQDICLYERSR